MKYLVILLVLALLIGGIAVGANHLSHKNNSTSEEPYRTDAAPIEKRFPALGQIEACYWKAGTFGNDRFAIGPTPYWMKGFAVISKTGFEELTKGFNWTLVAVAFEHGMDPSITGEETFAWSESEEFTRTVLGNGFIGKVYCDLENGIVYFEVENL